MQHTSNNTNETTREINNCNTPRSQYRTKSIDNITCTATVSHNITCTKTKETNTCST